MKWNTVSKLCISDITRHSLPPNEEQLRSKQGLRPGSWRNLGLWVQDLSKVSKFITQVPDQILFLFRIWIFLFIVDFFFFFAVTLIFKGTRLNCYFYLFYWVLTPPYILCLGSVPHWLYPSHSPVGTLLQGRIWLNRSLNHSLLARSSSSSFPTPSQASVALY